MARTITLSLAVLFVFALASESRAVLVQTQIFEETFDTNTANLAATEATYPDFSGLAGGGTINVASNQLQITKSSNNYFLTTSLFNEEIWVRVDMGGFPGSGVSNGQYATALVIGNRAFQFFPGCCNGAFRLYDFNPATGAIGTNLSGGDTSMGYTPASPSLHHVLVHSNNTGSFDVQIIDANNPLNIYTQSFSFSGFVPGKVGFSALHGINTSLFDNFSINALREEVVPAPEPNTVALLSLGGLLLVNVSRSKRRRQAAAVASQG